MKTIGYVRFYESLWKISLALCVIGFSGSCAMQPPPADGGDTPTTPQTFEPDFETLNITMKEAGRQLSNASMTNATTEDTDAGTRYIFPNASAEVAALTIDNIVLFSGMGLGKVTAITTDMDTVMVDTESATLDEFVQDGIIAWGHTVNFAQTADPQIEAGFEDMFTLMKRDPRSSQLMIEAGENPTFTFTGTLEGWDVSMSIQPTSNRLNLTISASRKAGNQTVVTVTGEGFVSNFRQSANIEYVDGLASNVVFSQDGLQGEMVISWAAFNPGEFINNELAQLKFPIEIPIPITVGGIPVLLKLQAIARVIPQLNFPDMSSQGSFKVVYNGTAGFDVTDTSVSPVGTLTSAVFSVAGETVSAGSVTVGFGVGLEFPRVEVSILGNSASAFISLDTFASGFFEPGLSSNAQPCQYGSINYQAVAGYQLSVFGLFGISGSTEVWKDSEKFFLNGTPCDE